jgi:tripartite-type tricarboxylate transporter receptor subunit TctC
MGLTAQAGKLYPPAIQRWVSLQMNPGLYSSADEARGSGHSCSRFSHQLALFAPTGVPKAIVETLHKAAIGAVTSPAIVEKLKVQFMRPVPTASPDDAQKWLQDQMAFWRRITEEVKIELPE